MLTVQCNLYNTTCHPGLQRLDSFGGQFRDWGQFVRLELFFSLVILPAIRAWQMLGEIILVLGLSSDNRLKRPFVSPATQYLGRISYGIYICHGPLLNIAQNPLFLFVWKFFAPEDESNTLPWAVFLIVPPVLFLCLLLLTEAFQWLVDKPSTVNPVSKVARKALHADRGKGKSRKPLRSLSLRDPYVSSLDPYSRIKNCAYSKSV